MFDEWAEFVIPVDPESLRMTRGAQKKQSREERSDADVLADEVIKVTNRLYQERVVFALRV